MAYRFGWGGIVERSSVVRIAFTPPFGPLVVWGNAPQRRPYERLPSYGALLIRMIWLSVPFALHGSVDNVDLFVSIFELVH